MTEHTPPVEETDIATRRRVHWRKTRRLTIILLGVWALATFGLVLSARSLMHVTVFGWPLPFYMSAQGTILIFVAIIAFYAWRMDGYDNEYRARDNDEN